MAEILATGRKNARDIRRAQQAIAAGATSVKLPEDDPVVYGQQIPQQPVQTEPASATSAASVTPAADEPEDNWLDSLTPYQSAPAQAAPVPPQPEASAQQHALTPEEQKANLQALYDSLPETEPVVAKEINELVVAPQIAELKAEIARLKAAQQQDSAGRANAIRRETNAKIYKHYSREKAERILGSVEFANFMMEGADPYLGDPMKALNDAYQDGNADYVIKRLDAFVKSRGKPRPQGGAEPQQGRGQGEVGVPEGRAISDEEYRELRRKIRAAPHLYPPGALRDLSEQYQRSN
jgi:hypothetical protein